MIVGMQMNTKMNKIKWCGYEWLTQERWGEIHPVKPKAWYDDSAVEIRGEQLILKTHKNPKYFPKLDIKSKIGVGLVSCTTPFKYGIFEIEAKLPEGPYLWPAFWTWAFESWPPEIDIFEGYSNKKGSYFNWNIDLLLGNFWRVKTNFHLGVMPDNFDLGAENHYYTWKDPSKTFNKYKLDWKEDSIKIFFNDKLVRSITDKDVLSIFNETTQNVIINNMVQKECDENNPPYSEFVVNYFKYTPLNEK
jgi:hypothetical protein